MADIFEYLKWRGDVPFSIDSFNEVDNLVLAELSYAGFDGLVPEDSTRVSLRSVRNKFFETHTREEVRNEINPIFRTPLLMDEMLTGDRFGKMTLSNFINVIEPESDVQFSAVTYHLSDGTVYIAFRGTDNTIVGWKEDFNMSYLPVTGGQRKALEYLNEVGSKIRRPIRVGGHSKGGNFALYASAFCNKKVKKRIIGVYTNDGPGFRKEIMEDEAYMNILPKVTSIVPDTSIIGMLLTNNISHHTVKSSDTGIMQHDGMTWQVERNRFEKVELSEAAKIIREIQEDWLSKLDDESRESFVNTLFSLFESTGAETFGEIGLQKLKSLERIFSTIQGLSKEQQHDFMRVIGEFLQSSGHTTLEVVEKILLKK